MSSAARPRFLRWPLPSFRDLNQVTVGIVAIIVFAGIVTAAFAVGTLGLFEHRYQLSAVVAATSGVKKGAEVRMAGVGVGSVTGIDADFERGQVVITFEVDEGVQLGPETTVEIAATTLLGGYHLRLDGPVEEPYLGDLPDDDPRRRIPLERTRVPASLIGTLSDTTNAVQALDIDAVNQLLGQLAGATDRNRDVVPKLVDSLTSLGAATAARENELRDLVADAEQITTAVAARDAELLRLIDAATVLLDTLSTRRDQLATTLGSGSAAVRQLTATLTEHREAIDEILASSHTILDAVDRNTELVNTSLAYAGPVFGLLADVRNPEGGFDVALEGFVVHGDQVRGLLAVLFPDLAQ